MDAEIAWRVMRIKLFKEGHTFDTIDSICLDDYFDILQFGQAEAQINQSAKNKKR